MTYPSFYELDAKGFGKKCGTMFRPDCDRAAVEGKEFARKHGIPVASARNQPLVVAFIIDNTVDFTNPTFGNLYVQDSEYDTDRLNKFIFTNVRQIGKIIPTLDTHYLFQPFHRFDWAAGTNPVQKSDGSFYKTGENPEPFTIITLQDLNEGHWMPTRQPKRRREMLEKLEAGGKKKLCIWPLHGELGTPGHALDPALMEAIHWHSAARNSQYDLLTKGMSQSAEHYGALMAEAQFSDDPKTQLNMEVVNKLRGDEYREAERIYIAGQAKSHCVLETVEQVVAIFSKDSPELLDRLYILQDCMTSIPDIKDSDGNVVVPFDKITEDRFVEFKKMGLKFVNSTDPIVLN